jgi:hypothetical protein
MTKTMPTDLVDKAHTEGEDERPARGRRNSSFEDFRKTLANIGQWSLEAVDPDKMGLAMSDEMQAKWDAPNPDYLKWSKGARFWLVCKRFPMHFLLQNLHCVPLIVVSLIPVFYGGAFMRTLIRVFPDEQGASDELENKEGPDGARMFLQVVRGILGHTSIYIMTLALTATLYNTSIVFPLAKKKLLPFYVLQCTLGSASNILNCINGGAIPGMPRPRLSMRQPWLALLLLLLPLPLPACHPCHPSRRCPTNQRRVCRRQASSFSTCS